MIYPAIISPDADRFLVTFPDIPEALTGAETFEAAKDMAADALATALEFYFEDGRPVPSPSAIEGVGIALPPDVADKVRAHNERLA